MYQEKGRNDELTKRTGERNIAKALIFESTRKKPKIGPQRGEQESKGGGIEERKLYRERSGMP